MRELILLFVCIFATSFSFAKSGYHIEMELENFEEQEIILASYYGASNKIIDTFELNKKGKIIAKGNENLKRGTYLVILPPENKFFEILIGDQQNFSFKCDIKDPTNTLSFKGSEENKRFYEYLRFMAEKRKEAEDIGKRREAAESVAEQQKIGKERDALDEEVTQYFDKIIKDFPYSINSLIVKAAKPPVIFPEALQGEDADDTERYYYYKNHYFGYFDLGDERLLRTNFFHKRIEYYIEKLTPQNPDSLIISIDYLLEPMKKDGELFKYYVSFFLNKYAKSKIVGMDGVYVHLVRKYYQTGMASWTDEETLGRIIDEADKIEPILNGKTVPDIRLRKKDGTPYALSDAKSDYIVLYFWDPDCGHCKKSSPDVIAFNEKYKDKGVTLLGICTEIRDDVKKCWDTIDEREYEWLNLVDPFLQSGYKTKFYIKSTPKIFILDKDLKIILKHIGAEQLDEVMDGIIKRDQMMLDKKIKGE